MEMHDVLFRSKKHDGWFVVGLRVRDTVGRFFTEDRKGSEGSCSLDLFIDRKALLPLRPSVKNFEGRN